MQWTVLNLLGYIPYENYTYVQKKTSNGSASARRSWRGEKEKGEEDEE